MKRIFLSSVLFAVACLGLFAQSGTNSPYSQFGLGVLSDQTSGFNRGMNGLALGFHEHNQVNYLNPASYSSIDSLSFIFDAGISGQLTNFKENNMRVNAKNASIEYVVAGFRAFKHVGMSFGVVPLTNIGYNYANAEFVGGTHTTTATKTYSGTGGLHQVFLGIGWEPFKGFAFGVNGSYLWGDYERSLVSSYSDQYTNTLSKYYTADVRNYKVDFGLQYTARLNKKSWLTLGLTYSLGHKLNANPECKVISTNSQTAVADTTTFSVKNGLELPHMFAGGLMYNYDNKLKVGVDYSFQKWADIGFPQYVVTNDIPGYVLQKDMLLDRHKVILGGEYCPKENGRNFFQRVHYRAGVGYATPYIKVNGLDGPKELSASLGLGIPIVNGYNNRSILNVSAQWVHSSASGLITENTFRLNIGLTFNERWFAKWKVE